MDKLVKMKYENKFPKMNFIGNKEKLVDWIVENIPKDVNSIFDAFAGGHSVSFELKKKGFKVISNDIMKINYQIGLSLIQNDKFVLNDNDLKILLNLDEAIKGFAYKNYNKKYYFEDECIELDTIINNVNKLNNKYKKSHAWILIRRAMIRKMPYSKFTVPWDKIKLLRDEDYSYKKYKRKRAYHNKTFKEHIIENVKSYNLAVFNNKQKNKVYNKDIFEIISKVKADLIYLDPPYTGTMNNYFSFYSIFDELLKQKKLKPFENNFINKQSSLELFEKLLKKAKRFKYCLLSYNNSSYHSKEELMNLFEKYFKNVNIIEKKHNYQITGKNKKNKNTEYLFIGKND